MLRDSLIYLQKHLCEMVIECCSQERTYEKFFGMLGERFCKINSIWADNYCTVFVEMVSSAPHPLHFSLFCMFFPLPSSSVRHDSSLRNQSNSKYCKVLWTFVADGLDSLDGARVSGVV